jgi:hypothetical protein
MVDPMTCLFGGTPGVFANLGVLPAPPARGYRVVSGNIWWRLLHWPWRQYLAAVACATPNVTPPNLAARVAAGVYFTDRDSLAGCVGPNDFAHRLSLHAQTRMECDLYGCAVIEFDVPASQVVLPPAGPGMSTPGLAAGGGREWLLQRNLALDRTMTVHYVERTSHGYRHFEIYL